MVWFLRLSIHIFVKWWWHNCFSTCQNGVHDISITFSEKKKILHAPMQTVLVKKRWKTREKKKITHLLKTVSVAVVLVIKNSPANAEDVRDGVLIPGSGRYSGEGHGNLLHYSCLENPT